ncbi:hypothetical protein DFH29DRAFT_168221 [Suillus ampliporus]|nr:hypothetical protein DFH29DRAFT_168221 [Suillus ampliporus]
MVNTLHRTPTASNSTAITSGSSSPTTTADSSSPTPSTDTSIAVPIISSTLTQDSAEPTTSPPAGATVSSTASSSALTTNSTSNTNVGAIAGGVIGGVIVLALLIIGTILFRRARRRRHVAPSSEFAETMKRGEMPVLRLDSGMEIIPSAPVHHVPLPPRQDSYYASPEMSDMKLPDVMMGADTQSVRHSVEKPLQPLRYPVQQDSNDSTAHTARGSSISSLQEFWSRDSGKFDIRLRSQSPLSTTADTGYSPLTQNTHPTERSHAVETVPNTYTDLWNLSVAPISRSRPASALFSAHAQALPPLVPVRRSVNVGRRV